MKYLFSFSLLAIALCVFLPRAAWAGLTSEVVVDASKVSQVVSRPFVLVHGSKKFTVPAAEFRTWIRTRTDGDTTFLRIVPGRIYDYLNVHVSPQVNTVGSNARIVLINGVWTLKTPAKSGKIVDGKAISLAVRDAVAVGKGSARVSVKPYRPPITSLEEFKKLGIGQKIGTGVSSFAGSPRNRTHNIDLGRQQFQGIFIGPNEEFSFNELLGSVTAEAGYKPELVIKENVTTPEYGGGLCQVSTTLFRAAVNTGLDVTARRSHAYPVQYYGKPGFDATIYSPAPDLRFKNTTGNWILIQTSIEGTKLLVDIYGKSDGRTVTVDGPHTVEKRPDGSIRALLRQTVKDKTGNVLHDELFKSDYKSPDLFPTVRKQNGETS